MYGCKRQTRIYPLKKITHYIRSNLANHSSKLFIIKIHIANQINLKRHPEIIVLRKEGEEEDIMQKLGYE
jgi:hypothetical protein